MSTITIDPAVRSGQPCIRGLRITVKDVLEYLAGGMTQNEVLKQFPDLKREDFGSIFRYAARCDPTQPDILALIPDAALQSERARRNSARRQTHSGGKNGRPRKLVTCAKCGATGGTVAMRGHRCSGESQH